MASPGAHGYVDLIHNAEKNDLASLMGPTGNMDGAVEVGLAPHPITRHEAAQLIS